ncbi:P-loop containing nucleoside triphosphate hydrolase protein [Lentinula raphanica]|nr:P-loop containing nucleoside triphosphate hydrolase protein [Lentinula raphanica]
MAPAHSRMQDHERDYERSQKKLEIARMEASRCTGYNSKSTCTLLRSEFTRVTGGLSAYTWQIDTAEAILLGLDCSVIAGTGAGKTMPFIIPLFIEREKRVIIISPLNALEEDQAKRFKDMGLRAVAVNGETWNRDIQTRLKNNEYNVIITSPDMALEHDPFRSLLSNTKLAQNILSIVIDEAHCISQWGEKFRPIYQRLGTLRALVPAKVPFLATSATMQPTVLSEVCKVLHINPIDSFHINVGTDRPNIAWFVHRMKAAKSDLEALNFVLKKDRASNEITELIQTMVFFDDINVSLEALKHLRTHLPPDLRGQIAVYHSRRSSNSKRRVLEEFRSGKLKILLTTEAAGMGCDLPSIHRVVQFMVPKSLAIWLQRAGRAARSPAICGEAFLLVQPTVFQEKKSKEAEDGDSVVFKKDVEPGLRLWIESAGCRRDIAAEYFNDNATRLGIRSTFTCSRKPWGPQVLLPPPVLTAIATKARLRTVDDLISIAKWEELFARKHGEEVLAILSSLDHDHHTSVEREKLERAEARHLSILAKREEAKRIRDEARLARDEEKRVQREAKMQAAQASRERKAREKAAERARKAAEKAVKAPARRGRPPKDPLSPKNTDHVQSIAFTPTAHDPEAVQNMRPRPVPIPKPATAPILRPTAVLYSSDSFLAATPHFQATPFYYPTMLADTSSSVQYAQNVRSPIQVDFTMIPEQDTTSL